VDNSPDMLAPVRQRAEKLGLQPGAVQAVYEALNLPRRYRTNHRASSSFQLLTDQDQAAQAMNRFYAHLEPGGLLAMPFMIIWKEATDTDRVEITAEKLRPEDGALMRRWSFVRYDIENQLEHTEDRLRRRPECEIVASSIIRRFPAPAGTRSPGAALYRDGGFHRPAPL